VAGGLIYNGGPNFARINRFSERPDPGLEAGAEFELRTRRIGGNIAARVAAVASTRRPWANQLIVVAPQMAAPKDRSEFKGQMKRTVGTEKVTHGWGGVKDPGVQKELRQEISRQSKGLTPATAPRARRLWLRRT